MWHNVSHDQLILIGTYLTLIKIVVASATLYVGIEVKSKVRTTASLDHQRHYATIFQN